MRGDEDIRLCSLVLQLHAAVHPHLSLRPGAASFDDGTITSFSFWWPSIFLGSVWEKSWLCEQLAVVLPRVVMEAKGPSLLQLSRVGWCCGSRVDFDLLWQSLMVILFFFFRGRNLAHCRFGRSRTGVA